MSDLISRKVTINALIERFPRIHPMHFIYAISDVPSVQSEQKKGKWIPVTYSGFVETDEDFEGHECSECGGIIDYDGGYFYKFCPHCGASMQVIERDTL